LAKRQLTWLRATPDLVEFDCLADDVGEQVCAHVQTALGDTAAAGGG
jgi:tRNA A37 N6-isopentenylltransferase MiaA